MSIRSFSCQLALMLSLFSLAHAQIDARLLTAIGQNDSRAVEAALKSGANPNTTDSLGATPLMWACYQADTAVVKLLIKAGATTLCRGVIRPDTNTYYGNLTGLAAGLNKMPLLRYLLETLKLPVNEPEYKPETKQNDGWTPAEWAADHGHLAMLQYLIGRGADLAVNKGNPLVLAIDSEQKAIALFLIEQGVALRKDHPNYATSLDNLAGLYESMGQYEKALPLYLECLRIEEQALGKAHPDYAITLNNLAGLYESMGQYEKALPLHLEDLAITEKALGKHHPSYATSLNNLAVFYKSQGQYEKALPYYEQALAIQEQALGKAHPDYASSLNNLAGLYSSMGQYEKALPLYLECLNIEEKALDKLHPDYALTLNNLAYLYERMGHYEKAIPLLSAARQQYKTQLQQNIAILNETALAQFQQKFDKADITYSVGYTANATALMGQLYTDALLSKGVGLLATQQLNNLLAQTQDTTTARIASQMRATKQTINRQLTLPLSQQRGLDSLQRQANALEQQLVLRLPEYAQAFRALAVEWPQVQAALKSDEAAIEFVSFDYYHKRWTDSTFYVALVLRPGWATPKMVFLSEENQLDSLIATGGSERRAAYVERLYTTADRGGVVAGADGKPRPSLYSRVWQPIDSLLTGVKRVYYSPTGLLHRLNLAALPLSRTQRIADKYQLTLLASTRQLALPPDNRPTNTRALLMGNIRYDLDSLAYRKANARFKISEAVASRGPSSNSFADSTSRGGSFWEELEHTGQEVRIASELLRNRGYQTDTLSGLAASEEAFYYLTRPSVGSPRVIHVATHGFFYDSPKSTTISPGNGEPKPAFIESKNALVRSGLGLAGGNRAWQGGRIPAGQEDGVLTAYEISLLDLHQTELVVLSACETGLGDLKGGEGVYGLQRAFKMAGVRNLVMSLWQVPDKATRVLMEKFYGYYAGENQSVRVAFDRAVADVQALYSEPYFWAGFVLVE